MATSTTLERVAELLPPAERERFFSMLARFRSLPEDDEYLQVLEAIGFMTLIWNQVPSQVQSILEGANPVTETFQSLKTYVQEAVSEAIPSHEDLRQIAQSLKEHDLSLKQAIQAANSLSLPNPRTLTLPLVIAFVLGALGAALIFQVFDVTGVIGLFLPTDFGQ